MTGTWLQKAQGVKLSKQGQKLDGFSDVSLTLLARDYKGFGNQQMTGVMEREENKVDGRRKNNGVE